MDTSSSIFNSRSGTSLSEWLIGKNPIVMTDAPVEQWVSFVRMIIEKCKPHLKYFDGFVEIKDCEQFRQYWWSRESKEAPTRIIFSGGIDWQTRICGIEAYSDGLDASWVGNFRLDSGEVVYKRELFPASYHDHSWGKLFVCYNLCLTIKGDVLICTNIHGYPGDKKEDLIQFSVLNDARLRGLILRSHGRVVDLLATFCKMLSQGAERRRAQLAELDCLNDLIAQLSRRIVCRVYCERCGASKERFGACEACERQPVLL